MPPKQIEKSTQFQVSGSLNTMTAHNEALTTNVWPLSKAVKQTSVFIKTLKHSMNCQFQIFYWTKMLSAELWICVCQLSLSPDRNFRAKVACWKLGGAIFFVEKKCHPKLIQDIVWNNYMISRLCYLPNSCLNTWFAKRPFNKEY